jgi:Sortilin, neurotensin receptor 3,
MKSRFASVILCLLIPSVCISQETPSSLKPDEKSAEGAKPSTDKRLPEMLGALKFRSIGPALMSGRISDIALDPSNPSVWYVAVGSGGVWKTTNAGTTFTPIFDSQPSYSIGCITIDPRRTDTVWIGTGENVGGRHVGFGDGIYKSNDGGKSFKNSGLTQSEHISKIVIDPNDSDTVYVAVQGPLWSPGGERGLFKTTDGGATWNNILSKGPYCGVTDVVVDPKNPNVVYAATHQRHRTVWALLDTGPESGIFKSTDGGATWKELTNGIPGDDKGKIALGISPQDNNVVYASVEVVNREGGFFRSNNAGESWEKRSSFVSGGTGPHYYQEIYLDPHRFDVIYHANDTLVRSLDGGKSFQPIEGRTKHVDNHAVVFHPTDKNFLLVGCDGGVYRSDDFGATYSFFGNLPLTQFYKVDVDYDLPFYHVVGGTQDNNSQYGPVATRFVQGITNSDWQITIGGDGHDNAIDPTDPNIIYCESQQGMIARFDRKTGESISIRPQPAAGEEELRFNWDSPILISPHNPQRLYFASKKLHRSDDRGDSWTTISPDLSKGQDRWKLPVMGRVWGIDAGFDLLAMSAYGNITSVSESPVVEGLIYVGTDDGLIQVTEDAGKNWRKIDRFFDVPEGAFINDVKADRHDANTVYACMDHHKTGDLKPYVIKSTDRGRTWTKISSNLPDRHLVWRIEQDHVKPNLLFLGTEFGVFTSLDAGGTWHKFSSGMPTIPVRDLAIQKRENDLVCATFGRGFYVLDDYSALRDLEPTALDKPAVVFPVRRSWWYRQADKLGGRSGFQGDGFFSSDNPTYGAVMTIHLRDSFKTLKATRKEEEQKAKKENKDVALPTLEELEKEQNELSPMRYVQITDESDTFIARVNLPNEKGLHRVAWDFRKAPLPGARIRSWAFPGKYKATVIEWDGKESKKLSDPMTFVVEALQAPSIQPVDRKSVEEFQKSLTAQQSRLNKVSRKLELAGKMMDEAKDIVSTSLADPASDLAEIASIKLEITKYEKSLFGSPILSERFIEQVPTPANRLNTIMFSAFGSTHGPTQTHREQFEIAKNELTELLPKVEQFLADRVTSFKKKLEGMGIELRNDPN